MPNTIKADTKTTGGKALELNLDPGFYGSFAEIGAGQEVGRWFFRVGGAAGTIAKTMSAYDKKVSDAIYGTGERYVSSGRSIDRENGFWISTSTPLCPANSRVDWAASMNCCWLSRFRQILRSEGSVGDVGTRER